MREDDVERMIAMAEKSLENGFFLAHKNERIRELAREAGLLTHNPEGRRTKLDVFAELLVRECVEIMKQHNFHQRTQIAILEHFGIKE